MRRLLQEDMDDLRSTLDNTQDDDSPVLQLNFVLFLTHCYQDTIE